MQKTLCFSWRWDADELKMLSGNILTRGITRRSCLLFFHLFICPAVLSGTVGWINPQSTDRWLNEFDPLWPLYWIMDVCYLCQSYWNLVVLHGNVLFTILIFRNILIPWRANFVSYYFSKNVCNSVCIDHLIVSCSPRRAAGLRRFSKGRLHLVWSSPPGI